MIKVLLFICLVMVVCRRAEAIDFPNGVKENDLLEWRGRVAAVKRPSWFYITFPLPQSKQYVAMRMQIQGFRYRLVFHAGTRTSEKFQGVCQFPQNDTILTGIGPGKSFSIIFRFTSRSIMVYVNGDLTFTQPFKIPKENKYVSLKRIASARVYHSHGITDSFRFLTDEMLARDLQEAGCGTTTQENTVPSFCPVEKARTLNNFRIVGGDPAIPGQHSWQVAIRKKLPFSNGQPHVCGGTLIGSCWVLTAAHCFLVASSTALKKLVVRVGDYYNADGTPYSAIDEYELSRDVDIDHLWMHPDYISYPTSKNDIALVKLSEYVDFNTFVKPACLPLSPTQFAERTSCGISGWGASNETQHVSEYPKCLQTAEVNIKRNRYCQRVYGDSFNDTIMMCAGKTNVDACLGDSGGPLVCSADNTGFTLWGITSWGIGCGDAGHPGVYTRVSSYIRWIYIITKLRPDDRTLTSRIKQKTLPKDFCQYLL